MPNSSEFPFQRLLSLLHRYSEQVMDQFANPVGQGLHEALLALSKAGILEQRDELDLQFRWSGSNRAAETAAT